MEPTKRIILNTLVQYSRSVLNILLSLFSTRLIVEALGDSDYGLYVVVGGVVALLGFITNALVITTQRYVSYYFGNSDMEHVKKIFTNSFFIHLVFSVIIVIVLYLMKDVIIYNWLNIEPGREDEAEIVYIITIFMLVVTILISPFKAVFIARENIVYISIVEIFDGILKLGIAAWVIYTSVDKLLLYAFLMFLIQIINLAAFVIYAISKFEECSILIKPKEIDFNIIRQLAGFAGWSTYSMGAVVLRSQGIQILLNRVFGTIINAGYGIAMQVYGSISFVATSVLNAMNPQIMKAEGEGNRKKMLHLAEMESKYSSMLLILIIIPLIFEATSIIEFWLGDMTEGADMFCQFILAAFIIDQLTYGLNTANQAIGRIKDYSLLMYTPKMLILIPMYYMLKYGYPPSSIMWLYVIVEAIVSLARLPYIKYTCGMSISHFVKVVFLPLIPLLLAQSLVSFICVNYLSFSYRFLVTVFVSIFIGLIVLWNTSLTSDERKFALNLMHINR